MRTIVIALLIATNPALIVGLMLYAVARAGK